jgi:hypothetical protein
MENVKNMDDLEDLEPSSLSELNPLEQQDKEEKLPAEELTNPNESMDVDKLNTFYYLKQKYEQDKKERCNKFALEKEAMSWKMKRAYFASKKPKCVNCKRKVGSIFAIKHTDGFRNFLGKCGDAEKPCEFHIEFNMPSVVRIDREHHKILKKLNELQESIILTKNKVIFGMLDPAGAVTRFDELNAEIAANITELEKYSMKLLEVTNNLTKKEELSNKIIEFNENVAELNVIMQKCVLEGEPLKKVVDYLVDIIEPSAKHLSQMKYATREVEKVLDTQGKVEKEYKYHTFEYKLSDLELPTLMEVKQFELGNNNFTPELLVPEEKEDKKESNVKNAKSRKTQKNRRLTKPANNKTVRNLDDSIDLNYVMNDLLQRLIMEDRLTITPREIFAEIETEYGVNDVRSKYGKIIKEYFGKYVSIWTSVYDDIMELVYNMALNKEINAVTYNTVKDKLTSQHSEIEFSVFKKVIKEIVRRYQTKLEGLSSDEEIPRPDWPKSP